MAVRVSSNDVKEIISTTLTLNAFILAANNIVDTHLSDQGLGEATLKEIERWLTAHFISIRDPEIKSESIGKAKQDFNRGTLGEGLKSTSWGQQALILDSTGILSSLGKKKSKIETFNFSDYTV